MKDFWRHQTIKSGQLPDGCTLKNAQGNPFPLLSQEETERQYGRLKIVSPTVPRFGEKKRKILLVQCVDCGEISYRDYNSVMSCNAGCRTCGNPRQAPKWLVRRCSGAKDRCMNKNHAAYARYGGRGIKFNFSSPTDMAAWIMRNLVAEKNKQIDRIDNNGHYEPGNIRLVTASLNQSNTRGKRYNAFLHRFRIDYQDVRYADGTICHLYWAGLNAEQIADRFYNLPSKKPKGVYGTYSTPDPDIASLLMDY